MTELDVPHGLPAIRVPTLILPAPPMPDRCSPRRPEAMVARRAVGGGG